MTQTIMITGGLGFIGSNAAERFLSRGWEVVILDDFSRPGAECNLEWLQSLGSVEVVRGDVGHSTSVDKAFQRRHFNVVLHLAGQVAVTTSVLLPRKDFESNALGTFNVLEAVRQYCDDAIVIYASTNKVYGGLPWASVGESNSRYLFENLRDGVDETAPLDFHSPYGCSKGAGDQYVIDYSRIYGLRTSVFRQSCIYGQRQFGVEDQGWVAWFAIAALLGKTITVYGDGKQVRDVLSVGDLIDAYEIAIAKADRISGQAFNIGGGTENTLSILELVDVLAAETGRCPDLQFQPWRPGDQKVYVSNIKKAHRMLGWRPKISVRQGVVRMLRWVEANRTMLDEALAARCAVVSVDAILA
jgi:CDP-paratose 2-epimerase